MGPMPNSGLFSVKSRAGSHRGRTFNKLQNFSNKYARTGRSNETFQVGKGTIDTTLDLDGGRFRSNPLMPATALEKDASLWDAETE